MPTTGEAGFLHQSGGDWHWIDEAYPADTISLRAVTSDNFVIIDTTGEEKGKPEVIGEVDFSSGLTTVHPKAIYSTRDSNIMSIIWISTNAKPILGAVTKTNEYGDYLSVCRWCAQPPRFSPDARALQLLLRETREEITDPDQWLFLDGETTGLAGGSGTYAFLVGIEWRESGGLEIEQFFMREYSEERKLLFALRDRIAERPVLVTFNGKSFDWPLLETRYRMSRKISLPTPRAHLDFLHPARNLWRLRLGSVRLSDSNVMYWAGIEGRISCLV